MLCRLGFHRWRWLRRLFRPERRVEVQLELPSLGIDRQRLRRVIDDLNAMEAGPQ